MANYTVPETTEERINDLNKLIDEFKEEYSLFVEKQKKASGHRARKALLSITKLARFVRKDLQSSIASLQKASKTTKTVES